MSEAIIIALVSMASTGTGGLIVWLRTRTKDRYEEMKLLQSVYTGMIADIMKGTEVRVENLTNEVHMLRKTVEKVYENCEVPECKNYKLKQHHINN